MGIVEELAEVVMEWIKDYKEVLNPTESSSAPLDFWRLRVYNIVVFGMFGNEGL